MTDCTKSTFVEIYDLYKEANTSRDILLHFGRLCKKLNIDLARFYEEKHNAAQASSCRLYEIIRSKTTYRKLAELWSLFDKKIQHKDYSMPLVNRRVLIIGSGPVGLRLSIGIDSFSSYIVRFLSSTIFRKSVLCWG